MFMVLPAEFLHIFFHLTETWWDDTHIYGLMREMIDDGSTF